MILTEKEARRKWCPQTSYAPSPGEEIPNFARCIASDCMAWRWAKDEKRMLDDDGDPIGFGRGIVGGYCGFAGKPEEIQE